MNKVDSKCDNCFIRSWFVVCFFPKMSAKPVWKTNVAPAELNKMIMLLKKGLFAHSITLDL